MTTFAEVILVSVDYQRSSDDAMRALQRDQFIDDVNFRDPVGVGYEVAEVSDVTLLVGGSSMSLVRGVEVRPGGNAAIGVIAELVDVETVFALLQSRDFSGYLHGITLEQERGERNLVRITTTCHFRRESTLISDCEQHVFSYRTMGVRSDIFQVAPDPGQ